MTSFVKGDITPKEILGWFFISTDGPYYLLTLAEFVANLNNMSEYCKANNRYDLGWVGKNQDMGIIFEFDHTNFCRNQFEFCRWGI